MVGNNILQGGEIISQNPESSTNETQDFVREILTITEEWEDDKKIITESLKVFYDQFIINLEKQMGSCIIGVIDYEKFQKRLVGGMFRNIDSVFLEEGKGKWKYLFEIFQIAFEYEIKSNFYKENSTKSLNKSRLLKYINEDKRKQFIYSLFQKKDLKSLFGSTNGEVESILKKTGDINANIYSCFLALEKMKHYLSNNTRFQLDEILKWDQENDSVEDLIYGILNLLFKIEQDKLLDDLLDKTIIKQSIKFLLGTEILRDIVTNINQESIDFFKQKKFFFGGSDRFEQTENIISEQKINFIIDIWCFSVLGVDEKDFLKLKHQINNIPKTVHEQEYKIFMDCYGITVTKTSFKKIKESLEYIELQGIKNIEKRKIIGKILFGNYDFFFAKEKFLKERLYKYFNSNIQEIKKFEQISDFFNNIDILSILTEDELLFIFENNLEVKLLFHNQKNIKRLYQMYHDGMISEGDISKITEIDLNNKHTVHSIQVIQDTVTGVINDIHTPKLHGIFSNEGEQIILEKLDKSYFGIVEKIGEKIDSNMKETFLLYISISEESSYEYLQNFYRMIEFFEKFEIYHLQLDNFINIELTTERIDYLFRYVWKRGGIDRVDNWEGFQNMIISYLKSGNNSEIQKYLQKISFFKLTSKHEIDKYILQVLRTGDGGKIDFLAQKICIQMGNLYSKMDPMHVTSTSNLPFGTGSGRFAKLYQKYIFSNLLRKESENSEDYLFRIGSINLGKIFENTKFRKGDIAKLGASLVNEEQTFSETLLGISKVILKCEKKSREKVDLRPLNNYYMSLIKNILADLENECIKK